MPEIKVKNGRICDNGLGYPTVLEGLDADLQRAYNLLNILRGSFRYDRTLGSRIPEMDVYGKTAGAQALRYAQEALLRCPELQAEQAVPGKDCVQVTVAAPHGRGEVTVYLKEREA